MASSKIFKQIDLSVNTKSINAKSIVALLLVCILASGCGADSPEGDSKAGSDKNSLSKIANTKPWNGTAGGYVSSGEPTTDRIELFIRLGKLLAAASLYNQRADDFRSGIDPDAEQTRTVHARVAAVFDENLLASYAAVDPVIEEKARQSKQQLSLQGLLSDLTQDQQISDLINRDRAQRDRQQAAKQKARDLMSRIHSVVLAFFPSRHEYLLASSALIRKAGDKMATAVSAKGVVLDTGLLQEVTALIDRSTKLDPRNISYCDAQRLPMRAHKDAINELLNKMVPIQLGEKLSVTASDVYGLATQAQVAGERFPIKDSSTCD